MKKYLINKRTIVEYRTNQKEVIFKNSKLNRFGYPLYWPTRNEENKLVFISFVDAQIFDKDGFAIDEEVASFDILDTDEFDPQSQDAQKILKFVSALLSPELRVKGGVYFKGEYYTGQLKIAGALKLYSLFMSKYFHVQDRESIEKFFPRDEKGFFPFWPVKDKNSKHRVIFSAVDASIYDAKTKQIVAEHINFDVNKGQLFSIEDKKDALVCQTVFSLLNSDYIVRGFYYKGKVLPNVISQDFKNYLAKGFIKKNFAIEYEDYLKENCKIVSKNGDLLYFPMRNIKKDNIVVSFRDGKTPLGDEYENFDICSNVEFNPRLEANQKYIRIIEGIINHEEGYEGKLYLDGVLIPNEESEFEIERRKNKVEKALKVRIDGDPDYLRIFNTFTTDDRNKLLLLASYNRTAYPNLINRVKKINNEYKLNKIELVFDKVNILDDKGNFIFKDNYSNVHQTLEEGFKFEGQELEIIKELFKQQSLVRGAVYLKGKNINREMNSLNRFLLMKKIGKHIKEEDKKEFFKSPKEVGCPYKMDKKSGMPIHWPVFDRFGKEVILSVSDADVWFKVSRTTVKAANNMNMDIYSGETFGLVGESGSGKTTISRAILGINKLRKGGIYWKGALISSGLNKKKAKAIKKNIQMIFQDPAASLNERANIDYIVSEGLYNFHLFKNKDERITKVTTMLREVGLLPEHLSRYPHEFSGGQRQRIGIARALVIEPELVLADEPISALDVSIRAQVLNLLRKLQKDQDLTYLFIAHDLSIIRYISDRIAVMHNGFIVESGLAEDIYSNPIHPYTKSLLNAIPQPDPRSKGKRKRTPYEQGNLDYSKCYFEEYSPNHFVLVNDELKEKLFKK